MTEAYLGQISLFGFAYAPKNFAACNGQLLAINQNQALFSLLGTTYGGNGVNTFGLPDLRSRTALHAGPQAIGGGNFVLGQVGGAAAVSLTVGQTPSHNHVLSVDGKTESLSNENMPTSASVLGNSELWDGKASKTLNLYNTGSTKLVASALGGIAGASQGHENRQPYTVVNFCICTAGPFPSRN
jgi:microcystin-dependent protein